MAQIVARDGELPKDVKKFDSNCITPGTDFMLKLSLAMNKWIEFKQRTDPFWKNGATVIFSGPDVPGKVRKSSVGHHFLISDHVMLIHCIIIVRRGRA